ncbi:MAG: hypothetical protein ACYS0G_04455 [Planctomycetota bacterium]|jgi:hypothetical protein
MRFLISTAALLGLCLTGLSMVRCTQEQPAEPPPSPTSSTQPSATAPQQERAAWQPSDDPEKVEFVGLVAPKPAAWIERPPAGTMRAANFTVPGTEGQEAAQLVVFYFGPGQGGSIDSNIARWQSQFKPQPDGTPTEPRIDGLEADGMPVTLVELAGEWQQMNTTWYQPDQLFLAAIVEAPTGNVFIRLTGQTATVEANRGAFMDMVEGLRKQ